MISVGVKRTVRRGEGAACEGPVRGSGVRSEGPGCGPKVSSDGPFNSDFRAITPSQYTSHRRPVAPSDRLRVEAGLQARLEQPHIKRQWQQVLELMPTGLATKVGKNYFEVATEFPQDLAACTAGWRRRVSVRNDRNATEFAMPFGERLEHRDTLGADREPVRRVLDVAAGDDRPISGLERRTDFEA